MTIKTAISEQFEMISLSSLIAEDYVKDAKAQEATCFIPG